MSQSLTDRLVSLWDHLGLRAAHVATQMPGDIAAFARLHPARIAGLLLCVPSRLDPAPFAALATRTVMIAGERGMTAEVTARAEPRLPGSRRAILSNYEAPGWADVVADQTTAITAVLRGLTGQSSVPNPPEADGQHAGITYRLHGKGPALVLFPFFLAPSQWEPAIPELARAFTVIALGGRHLGGVAALEDRASGPSYAGMIDTLFDAMAPSVGETVLDVGCGSGALDRRLARRLGGANPINANAGTADPLTANPLIANPLISNPLMANPLIANPLGARPITACDVNPFLLREAASLAAEEGLADRIAFRQANAERLPFADASFDHAFTVTVLEECDADLALSELFRVVRPGGRVGVIVRAIDMPQWWHLDLPEPVRRKANVPPQSCGPRGVADASLYRRMRACGFDSLTGFPALVTFDRPDGPIWRYREDHVLSQLDEAETVIWRSATAAAREDGLLFMANPLHRAVGTKPA